MTRYRHPEEPPPARVTISLGQTITTDDEGVFECEDQSVVRSIAERCDTTVAEMRIESNGADGGAEPSEPDAMDGSDGSNDAEDRDSPARCEVVKQDGEVCGRELPCPYHSNT